jgi:hypothetical protein
MDRGERTLIAFATLHLRAREPHMSHSDFSRGYCGSTISGADMKEQSWGLPVYLLGYPIALVTMIVIYASEVWQAGRRATSELLAARARADHT